MEYQIRRWQAEKEYTNVNHKKMTFQRVRSGSFANAVKIRGVFSGLRIVRKNKACRVQFSLQLLVPLFVLFISMCFFFCV